MRKVAIYARVSTEHEEKLSALDNQIQYYDDKIKNHPDWELYDRYIDEGITGTSIHKRRSFMRMIEDAKAGKFDLIVPREVSRFARNTVDTLQVTRDLKRIGVEVYFTEDNIWTFKDDDGELKLTIMATLAQNESKKISQRVKAGQMITFKNGVFYGTGNILGYDKVGKDMVINPEQAKTVRFIFESYIKGMGLRKLQYELEKRGYLTATGLTRWHLATINHILTNPFYCGTIEYRKSYIPDYLEQKPKKNTGEVEKVVVEGKHEPIVTKEEFNKVQEILNSHATNNTGKVTKVGQNPTQVWGKKLLCRCGSTLNKRKYHKYEDKTTWCYQCYHQIRYGSYQSRLKNGMDTENTCDVKLIAEWKLRLIGYMVFEKIWGEKQQILDLVNQLLDLAITNNNDENEYQIEIKNLERILKDLNSKQSKLLDTFLSDIISQDDYKNKKAEIDEDIDKINNRMNEIKDKLESPIMTLNEKIQGYKDTIKEQLNYKRGELSDELVDSFVKSIIVSNDKIEWHLSFTNEIVSFYDIIDKKEKPDDILLGTLVITRDNLDLYSKYDEELKKVKFKEDIVVDIYI